MKNARLLDVQPKCQSCKSQLLLSELFKQTCGICADPVQVYALSLVPDMVSSISTFTPVSSKIIGGADLFLQGIAEVVMGIPLGPFHAHSVRSVKVLGNDIPFCIGRMCTSLSRAQEDDMKGKGLEVMHCFGDALWNMGSKAVPNSGFTAKEIIKCESSPKLEEHLKSSESQDGDALNEEMAQLDVDGNTEEDFSDTVLHIAVGAAKNLVSSSLPIKFSDFFTKYMQPLKPVGMTIDFKHTRFKKLGKLLEVMAQDNIISIKQIRKELHITQINRDHSKIATWKSLKMHDASTALKENGIKSISYEYKASASLRPLFGEQGRDKERLYTKEDVLLSLKKYINSSCGGLIPSDGDYFVPDMFLVQSLWGKKEGPAPGEKVLLADVLERLLARMQKWHRVEKFVNGESCIILNKGDLKPIYLTAEKKNGRKITSIVGMESFGYEAEQLASLLQKKMKTACYISVLPGKNEHRKEITMGGDWLSKAGKYCVYNFFIDSEGIPEHFIVLKNRLKKSRD